MTETLLDSKQLNVSLGTYNALQTLVQLNSAPKRPYWTGYLINMATVVRNAYDSKVSPDVARQAVLFELQHILTSLQMYASTKPMGYTGKPFVVVYFPRYEEIPETYRKNKPIVDQQRYLGVRDELFKIVQNNNCTVLCPDLNISFLSVSGLWPTHNLATMLTERYGSLASYSTLMLSHVPLDFHLNKYFNRFQVLESYTGRLKVFDELANKILPNIEVPFNRYTHILFGDKIILKSILTRAQKNTILETAKRDHWKLLPVNTIAEAILNTKVCSREILLSPQF